MELALQIPITDLIIYGDSELLIKELRGEYVVRKRELHKYHQRAEQLLAQFDKDQTCYKIS